MLFLIVSVLLVLIFSAGKKTYVVTYDLNGGTLISGSLEQHITQGQNAVPPVVVKDGAYLHSWSASSNHITKDMKIEAVWEYKTTDGIIYYTDSNQNFAEIEGAYKYISGEVYLGAYFGDKKILGIRDGAFADCSQITKVYLLDGLLSIGDSAFENCTSLTEIATPETVIHLGARSFGDCESLVSLTLNEGLLDIGERAFEGCTALTEIFLPSTIQSIGTDAFAGCEDLIIKINMSKKDMPEDWAEGWNGLAEIIWLIEDEDADNEDENKSDAEDTETSTNETEDESLSESDTEDSSAEA